MYNTLSKFRKNGFEGSVDIDLGISLYEYGLIHKTRKNDIIFIYGVKTDENGEYIEFETIEFTEEEFTEIISAGWFEIDSFLSFIGTDINKWQNLPLYQKIYDCISYYGYENVFGSNYGGYEITTNTREGHSKIKEYLND